MQIAQILASYIQKNRLKDSTGDPWEGRTLEWSVVSPPPFYNFTTIPNVTTRDAFMEMKRLGIKKPVYEDIHMPKNTAMGIYISLFATLASFAFVWEIIWLIVASIIGIIITFVIRGFDEESEYTLTAEQIQKIEEERTEKFSKVYKPRFNAKQDEDMGITDLIKYIYLYTMDVIHKKKWRSW
jgi:cytochrome o ubiquinol oxidase subunit 1